MGGGGGAGEIVVGATRGGREDGVGEGDALEVCVGCGGVGAACFV